MSMTGRPPGAATSRSPVRPGVYAGVGVLLAAGGAIAFSMRPVLIRLAYASLPDATVMLALRMLFALPFFVAVAVWSERSRRRQGRPQLTRRDAAAVLALGFLGYSAASLLDLIGLLYVDAGIGRLVLFLYPTIVVALSFAFFGRRLGRREAVALAITYAGLVLVLAERTGEGSHDFWLGFAFIFASAAAYALYLVVGGEVVRRIGSGRFTAYAMIVASVFAFAHFAVFRPLSALAAPSDVYAIAAVIAVVSTVVPVFMVSEALRRIGASRVAMIGALGPVSATILGVLLLGEPIGPLQVVGGLVVLGGVLLVSYKP